MKLSEQLKHDHESGDFGRALDGYSERAKDLEDKLELAKSKPMQPLVDGRFKENKIVNYCLDNKTDMNDIARHDFTNEDREQFAQLIGYSLGGYSDLSYVSDESYYRAEEET
jgi:hypothetical protein